jgi:2-hydroxy-6-oxonona-2,4-dienedioate hydrolase
MVYSTQKEGKFEYIETKGGNEILLLLHGLFGELSNFDGLINCFGATYNVVIPILPILELPLPEATIPGYVKFVEDFVKHKQYDKMHVIGNSLGGHIAILFALANPEKIASITLTGSSGLFESAMGNTYPKRGDYNYITTKAQETFYDPAIATKELVDIIYNTIQDRRKTLNILSTAKSAVRQNLEDKLHAIKAPTLLIWGLNDLVTPAFVGEKFKELIPHAHLEWVDKCGHAAMMEHPDTFNAMLERFLNGVLGKDIW